MNPNKFSKSRSVGVLGEDLAVHYLRLHGYTVKERNYRAGHHEIDVVATTWRSIVFVEVKARSYRAEDVELLPPPSHAVNADKRKFTRQAARQYLFEHPTRKKPRMDVIEIWLEHTESDKKPRILRLHHIKGAY